MTLPVIATALFVLMFAAEAKSLRRGEAPSATSDQDQSSLRYILWATVAVPFGVWVGTTRFGRINRGRVFLEACGFGLLLLGWLIRRRAIKTLREYFTVNVAVRSDHRLITTGLYGSIRHPSYTGYLLRFLGLGFAWANWITIPLVFLPQLLAILYRIRVEEQALAEALGDEYLDYCRATRRLIPKIY